MRARAIENQAFAIAANQVGEHPGSQHSGGRSMIVDPWGVVLAQAPDTRELHPRRARSRAPASDPRAPARARQPPSRGLSLACRGDGMSTGRAPASSAKAADKRRLILDAAVRVFARQGFHACRVSDIADEAGVAYGLVYHYFASKDEVLDTLFLERWNVMLELIREVDATAVPVRDKLAAIASFIVDSYRHDPDLMKVIIVEVTRAANSFGNTHIGDDPRGLRADRRDDRRRPRQQGVFKAEIEARFAAMAFYGAIEQLLTGWIFDLLPQGEEHFERAKWLVVETVCGGLESRERAATFRTRPTAGNRLTRDGERDGQAVDVVGPAGGRQRAGEHRRPPRGGARVAARVRRGAAGVSAQPPPPAGERSANAAREPRRRTSRRRSPRCPSARRCSSARRSSSPRSRSPKRRRSS